MPSIKSELNRKKEKSNKLKNPPEFKSTHNLEFLCAPWWTGDFIQFKIGTCTGLWTSTPDAYQILAVTNDNSGNGHLQDVFDWFENSCKRDKRCLEILEVWNEKFKEHLISKRGFEPFGTCHVRKKMV